MKITTHSLFTHKLILISLTCTLWGGTPGQAGAQTDQDMIEVARGALKSDRQAVVAQAMELTEAESKGFWPLYREYRYDMDKVNDALMKLVLEYGKLYPTVSDDRATQMLKDYTAFQRKQVETRTAYLKKFSKVLPAAKALRLAQVETRLDLVIQLQLASRVPLVPVQQSQAPNSSK